MLHSGIETHSIYILVFNIFKRFRSIRESYIACYLRGMAAFTPNWQIVINFLESAKLNAIKSILILDSLGLSGILR